MIYSSKLNRDVDLMKALLAFFTLSIASLNLTAKEVHLLCKGVIKYTDEKPSKVVYEIDFDDQKNRILSMTKELSIGCTLEVNDEMSRARSCDCRFTTNEISCESIAEGRKFTTHLHQDYFTLNRRTGRMTTRYSFTGTSIDGSDFSLFRAGELWCERFVSKKI